MSVNVVDLDAGPSVLSCLSSRLRTPSEERKVFWCHLESEHNDESEGTGAFRSTLARKPILPGSTIRPFLSQQTGINGHQQPGTSTRDLTVGLLVKLLNAGIDLIEWRR